MLKTCTHISPCNPCNPCNPCGGGNQILPPGFIPSNQLDDLPVTYHIEGSWGPIAWVLDITIDRDDIKKSSFKVKLELFGISIVDTTIDYNNPKLDINLTLWGVGLLATLGVDFTNRLVYLRGTLDFKVYKKDFNLVLFRF